MMIAIASDHAGFVLKAPLIEALNDLGHEIDDMGCRSEDSCDHSDFSLPLAEKVATGTCASGVLICGSGVGMVIGANKVDGIAAAMLIDEDTARMSRQHNNTNIAVFAGRLQTAEQVCRIVTVWLETEFEGGRHERRMDKIHHYIRKLRS